MTTASQAPGLLCLSDPTRSLSRGLLDQRGGFVWWYLDALDAKGDGFTLIWSFGLPFLPGYLDAARRGRPEAPRARPSLNLALYRGGRQVDYALQEHAPEDAAWGADDGHFRFGQSRISSTVEGGERRVEAELDLLVPGGQRRLTGRITVVGAAARAPTLTTPPSPHEWCPLLGPAQAVVDLETADGPFRFQGLAYHDRNGSPVGLDQLGIADWAWGRTLTPDLMAAYYVVWPQQGAPFAWWVEVDRGGRLTIDPQASLQFDRPQRAFYGMAQRNLVVAGRRIEGQGLLEDGPFYLRARQTIDGQPALGEWVRPDRIDLPRHRSMVKMRVHRLQGDNSLWLPLFNGPQTDRLRRLWRWA
ncbi:MAG: hypothetical protein IPG45_32905 [Deltaproteobacteria bacterium]|nr:hypothetical protein [Deltaproteobacteria bacterium]